MKPTTRSCTPALSVNVAPAVHLPLLRSRRVSSQHLCDAFSRCPDHLAGLHSTAIKLCSPPVCRCLSCRSSLLLVDLTSPMICSAQTHTRFSISLCAVFRRCQFCRVFQRKHTHTFQYLFCVVFRRCLSPVGFCHSRSLTLLLSVAATLPLHNTHDFLSFFVLLVFCEYNVVVSLALSCGAVILFSQSHDFLRRTTNYFLLLMSWALFRASPHL